MSVYYGLEDGTGHLLLEDGTGGYIMEDATLFTIADTLTLLYDVTGVVSDTITLEYDMTGQVADTISLYYDINGDASTQLVRQNLAPTLTALNLETKIIEKTNGPYHYSAWIHLTNMASGDIVVIRVYKWETTSDTYALYEEKTIRYTDLKGTETNNQTAIFLPFIPAERYKVTIEQTAGTLFQIPWEMFQTS